MSGNGSAWAKRLRVLLVEEEILVRLSAAQYLRDCGFRVFEACNADEALQALEYLEFEVVITDYKMAGALDGLGLMRWLEMHRPRVRAILSSAASEVVPLLEKGGLFLAKPYRLADLDAIVRRAVDERPPA
jgi:DNA-binding NtrC family response regulator